MPEYYFFDQKIQIEDFTATFDYFEYSNAIFLIISDRTPRIGTITLAAPFFDSKAVSGQAIGEKFSLEAQTISQYLSTKSGKISFVSLYVEKAPTQFLKVLLKAIESLRGAFKKPENTKSLAN
ncbi:MAG: hypothetical protein ACFFBD_13415 [Candidatus Hodarchaeota archaeon]